MARKRSVEKPKNFKSTFKRVIKELSSQKLLISIIIFLSILSAIITIASPLLLKGVLNNATPKFDETGFTPIDTELFHFVGGKIELQYGYFFGSFGILIGLYLAAAGLSWAAEWLSTNISNKYGYGLRSKIQNKLEKLPLAYFDKVPYGDTLSTGTNDVDNISRNLTSIITQIFSGVTLFLGTLLAMFITEYRLAFVAIAVLPVVIILVIIVSKFSQSQFVTYRAELGELNGKVEENYAGYKIIKLFNKEKDVINSFNETNEKLRKSDKMSQFLSALVFPATTFINNLAFVGIAVVAGIIQEPATMITFFLLLNLFTRPFTQIGQILNVIQSVTASAERVYTLLDEEEQIEDKFITDAIAEGVTLSDSDIKKHKNDEEAKIIGKYEFQNVDFSYTPDKRLIEDMNLTVQPGDKVAIVGPTGAGKTTIVNLIMRFYEINKGRILLDGKDLRDYDRSSVRGIVGMVLQETWLFRGTIRDNITYGAPDATDEEVIQACKEAHIYHFIQTLPGKFDFMLNEDGNNISQGQKQLITIARAILSKPKVMILDEATSSVDTRTEQQIQDAMNHIMEGRTSFIIAHRLSTIKNAKLILVMKKGHIIEMGNHKELLQKGGFYADLYNSQFLGNTTDMSVADS